MARRPFFLTPGLVLLAVVVAGCSPGAGSIALTPTATSVAATVTATQTAAPVPGPPAKATSVPATPVPSTLTPVARATASPGATATAITRPTTPAAAGTLTGHANIGPLTPVERIGVPTLTPAPEVCTSRGLAIYEADGTTLVTSLSFQPDCTYRVALPPGTYVVKLRDTQRGIGGSSTLPKTVTIESGQTVVLDIEIDTGIR